MKVYIVTEGEYSSYRIREVFSTLDAAEKYQALHPDTNFYIETFDVDNVKITCDKFYYGLCVECCKDGHIRHVKLTRNIYPVEECCVVNSYYNEYMFPTTKLRTKSYERLVKIARDKIAEYEAKKEGIV